MVRETCLRTEDFIAPLFIVDGSGPREPIGSMPGVERLSIEELLREAEVLCSLGIRGIALFPKLDSSLKDERGSAALDPEGLVLRAVRRLKRELPDLTVITDVALDPYTSHGHDGILTADGKDVDNDGTVEILAQMAVLQAAAGVDIVAPSDMMDGRVRALRSALDRAGHTGTLILAYSAKFASAYYGPFRDAVGSKASGDTTGLDKRTYQIEPANARQALREMMADVEEGADIVMVKPAGPYLDILRQARDATNLPLAAYQVSGEYAQIHAAARCGWLDLARARDEALLGIKRAGADMILTYFAKEMAESLRRVCKT
jgi:porphobilinogen synthase